MDRKLPLRTRDRSAWIVPALALLLACGARAQAAEPATMPRVDQRQAVQERRIDRGQASGSLTPREAARLERGQAAINAAEARATADGRVTARERAALDRSQDRAGHAIRRHKHDRQARGG